MNFISNIIKIFNMMRERLTGVFQTINHIVAPATA